ncbi:CYTH and CHAD domain-containing protein [Thalassotalea sp. Y01]|uniref:CYTH domain-containing protein n=1 Tax=Thalassotalea sp. Y01 TaxID=2729613 RepID=UPI00145D53FF|nr:CYTH and CHAD domain-containing protein [Thalassotalea sp. Y01]NMP15135.1 CYTH and CHAD domain-containing protein [Thalassotalea sp. Y01]
MDIEIELKYLLEDTDVAQKLANLLTQHKLTFSEGQKRLNNTYFDTPDLALRRQDIGLRIRTFDDGSKEQTVKLAGQVIGGLHKRPEYNVSIDVERPNLSLFADDIWPEALSINSVANDLVPLFTTNFSRHFFHIHCSDGSEIELVFDQGEISSGERYRDIYEIELELLSGDPQQLFELAQHLFAKFNMRPGTQSKAARGYQLSGIYQRQQVTPDNSEPAPTLFDTQTKNLRIDLDKNLSIPESFQVGMQQCLVHVQRLVSEFLEEPHLYTLKDISDTLALTRHGIWLYRDYLPTQPSEQLRQQIKTILTELSWVKTATQIKELTKRKGSYRKKIEKNEELLATLKEQRHELMNMQEIKSLMLSERFNMLQLTMLQFAIADLHTESIHTKLMDLAPSWLSISLDTLQQSMPAEKAFSTTDYINHHQKVVYSLLTGSWFGRLYNKDERRQFRGPWLDIHHGIDELETLYFLKHYLQQREQKAPAKLVAWIDDKVESLLLALEHTRKAAVVASPYWLK